MEDAIERMCNTFPIGAVRDRIGVAGVSVGRGHLLMMRRLVGRLCRRFVSVRRRAGRCARDRGEGELLDLGELGRPNELADGLLVDTQPLHDRAVAQSLRLQPLYAAQPLPGNTPSTATPTLPRPSPAIPPCA